MGDADVFLKRILTLPLLDTLAQAIIIPVGKSELGERLTAPFVVTPVSVIFTVCSPSAAIEGTSIFTVFY
jgi:hypothetical protein